MATSVPAKFAIGAAMIGSSMPNRSSSRRSGHISEAITLSVGAAALAEKAQAERVELDEASRVLLIVGAGIILESHDRVRVERFRRRAADDNDVALIELEPDLAFDMLLALIDQRLQHLAIGREPEAVIDELGIARHQLILEMHRLAVERERLDRPVRDVEYGTARRLVDAARLHADEAVLDEIDTPDAILLAVSVELGEERSRG